MKLTTFSIFYISLSLLLVSIAEAKIYKWKDDKGQVHYASTPPKADIKTSILTKDLLFINKNEPVSKNKQTNKSLKTNNQDPIKSSNKKVKACRKKRKNLNLLQKNLITTWIENGKETQLSGQFRKEKIESLKEELIEYCDSNSIKTKEKSLVVPRGL